jgi:hypothetical protein
LCVWLRVGEAYYKKSSVTFPVLPSILVTVMIIIFRVERQRAGVCTGCFVVLGPALLYT